MKKLIILTLFFFSVSYAQIVKDVTVYRGDSTRIEFRANGNITNKGIVFVVKLTKSFSSPRLIQKSNLIAGGSASEITAVFSAPQTKVTVILGPEDTQDLTGATYYYDIVAADAGALTSYSTFNYGIFKVIQDIQTPFDGTDLPEDGTRITTVSLDNGTIQDELIYWDTTLARWEPSGTVLSQAQNDSMSALIADTANILRSELLANSDTTQFRTFSDSKYLANGDSTQFRTFSDSKYLANGDSTQFRTFSNLKYLLKSDTSVFVSDAYLDAKLSALPIGTDSTVVESLIATRVDTAFIRIDTTLANKVDKDSSMTWQEMESLIGAIIEDSLKYNKDSTVTVTITQIVVNDSAGIQMAIDSTLSATFTGDTVVVYLDSLYYLMTVDSVFKYYQKDYITAEIDTAFQNTTILNAYWDSTQVINAIDTSSNLSLRSDTITVYIDSLYYLMTVDSVFKYYQKDYIAAKIDTALIQSDYYKINVKTADKIAIVGDSYIAPTYVLQNEAATSKLSRMVDFIVRNNSAGGTKIDRGYGTAYYPTSATPDTSYKYSALETDNIKYAVVEYMINDNTVIGGSSVYYNPYDSIPVTRTNFRKNYEKFVLELQSFGVNPIVSSPILMDLSVLEGEGKRVALNNNLPYLNISGWSYNLNGLSYKTRYLDGHPNTAGQYYNYLSWLRHFENIKPKQSIKLWKAKNVEATLPETLLSLRFDNKQQQIGLFDEYVVSHTYGGYDSGPGLAVAVDEYSIYLSNNPASYVTNSTGTIMAEFVIPFTYRSLQKLKLTISQIENGTYNVYLLSGRNPFAINCDDTLRFWDLETSFTGTSLSYTFSDWQNKIFGNKIYLMIVKDDLSSFKSYATDYFINLEVFGREEEMQNKPIEYREYGGELVTEPYFNTDFTTYWDTSGIVTVYNDSLKWLDPVADVYYKVYSPAENIQDSIILVEGGSSITREISLSGIEYDDDFCITVYSESFDTTSLDATINASISYKFKLSDAYETTEYYEDFEVYPTWADKKFYLQKPNESFYQLTKPNATVSSLVITIHNKSINDCDIQSNNSKPFLISKVGMKKCLRKF